jgi:hypothetical protein
MNKAKNLVPISEIPQKTASKVGKSLTLPRGLGAFITPATTMIDLNPIKNPVTMKIGIAGTKIEFKAVINLFPKLLFFFPLSTSKSAFLAVFVFLASLF